MSSGTGGKSDQRPVEQTDSGGDDIHVETVGNTNEEVALEKPDDIVIASSDDKNESSATSKRKFGAQDELETAIAYFRGIQVGKAQAYKQPFTAQIRGDIEKQFSIDGEYFRAANADQSRVLKRYFLLRIFTLILFFILLTLQFSVFKMALAISFGYEDAAAPVQASEGLATAIVGGNKPQWFLEGWLYNLLKTIPVGWHWILALILLLGLSGILFAARMAARHVAFFVLTTSASELSFKIFTQLDNINTRVTDTCSNSRDRVGDGDWHERAKNWIIIALWNAKRGEYLDRYVTTVIWTVRTYILLMEYFFLIIKFAATAFCFYLFVKAADATMGAMISSVLIGSLLFAQTYFLWHRIGQKPEDFWTTQFRKSAPSDAEESETYADKIGRVVENLVHEVIAKEFGSTVSKNSR